MRSFLRNIRSKPKAVRNQYAFGIAATFTSVVALIWLFTGMSLDTKTRTDVATNETAPFANLTEQIKEQWAMVRGSLKEETASTTPTVAEDPLSLTISPETKAELASTTTEWSASSTVVDQTEYVVVQIATTSSQSASSTTATSTPTSN